MIYQINERDIPCLRSKERGHQRVPCKFQSKRERVVRERKRKSRERKWQKLRARGENQRGKEAGEGLVGGEEKKESREAKRRERGLSKEKKKGKSRGKGGFYERDGAERQKRKTLGKEFLKEEWGRLEVFL